MLANAYGTEPATAVCTHRSVGLWPRPWPRRIFPRSSRTCRASWGVRRASPGPGTRSSRRTRWEWSHRSCADQRAAEPRAWTVPKKLAHILLRAALSNILHVLPVLPLTCRLLSDWPERRCGKPWMSGIFSPLLRSSCGKTSKNLTFHLLPCLFHLVSKAFTLFTLSLRRWADSQKRDCCSNHKWVSELQFTTSMNQGINCFF